MNGQLLSYIIKRILLMIPTLLGVVPSLRADVVPTVAVKGLMQNAWPK
jgi:ABC-type microcin C transport system permease subunit YejB